jgi:predicted PP-loop superfamily ATPase
MIPMPLKSDQVWIETYDIFIFSKTKTELNYNCVFSKTTHSLTAPQTKKYSFKRVLMDSALMLLHTYAFLIYSPIL